MLAVAIALLIAGRALNGVGWQRARDLSRFGDIS
jgi:hypothetical protein